MYTLSEKYFLECSFFQSGCVIALLITLMRQTSRVSVYIGTCAIGLFLSSLSPTAMALTEQYIQINGTLPKKFIFWANCDCFQTGLFLRTNVANVAVVLSSIKNK